MNELKKIESIIRRLQGSSDLEDILILASIRKALRRLLRIARNLEAPGKSG